ncbi:protein kinase [Nocardia sp. 2]|uniref:non-specific serine/threonine protein kinase n=1 Tax=Nocardia acididurans TaxID=2802282 RepID=A0ABS1M2S8_9NOCA|nr:serine/threonine-protein kinase [Nocardia acididurans]MBL1074962.1 protein kinase [Nocardia acididurans]
MGDRWFGRYRLESPIGSGGSGQVWRAHDSNTDRTVALKVLAPDLVADPAYRERFQREARAAARLRGRHILPIHNFGEQDGRLFIDMQFVDGTDLGLVLRRSGPMPPPLAVDIVAQAATALDEAHRAGLIHRDVKPSNILLTRNRFAYLIDFGTAHRSGQSAITLSGMVIGTPAYMAPERFTGSATARSDIYSLACVLYECLTGRRPFTALDPARQMHAHLTEDPPRASAAQSTVPQALDEVICRGMAKKPDQRYATAGEFSADARRALFSGTGAVGPAAAAAQGAATGEPTKPFTEVAATRLETRQTDAIPAVGSHTGHATKPAEGEAVPAARRRWKETRAPVIPVRDAVTRGPESRSAAPVVPRRVAIALVIIALLAAAGGTAWLTGLTGGDVPTHPQPSQQSPAGGPGSGESETTPPGTSSRAATSAEPNPQPAQPDSAQPEAPRNSGPTTTAGQETTAPPATTPPATTQPNATVPPTAPGQLTIPTFPGLQPGERPSGNDNSGPNGNSGHGNANDGGGNGGGQGDGNSGPPTWTPR